MSDVLVRVGFTAVLAIDQFASQRVALGEPYPEIDIHLLDSSKGLHDFRIEKRLPHLHPTVLDPAIEECRRQIEYFWTVLAFVRDTVIVPTGQTFYEVNGRDTEYNRIRPKSSWTLVGLASTEWFDMHRDEFHSAFNLERLKRLSFALGIPEPVGRYVALYALLLSEAKDSQSRLDEILMKLEPTLERTRSPKNGHLETIFTRLRNELAHVRPRASFFETHREIELQLPRFTWIVKTVLRANACDA